MHYSGCELRRIPLLRLSEKSEWAPFCGPTSPTMGRNGAIFCASRNRETRDPTRRDTFQTVSEWVFSEVEEQGS